MTTGQPPREVTIPDEPLGAALDRAAARCPDRVAVDFLTGQTTYGELADAVARGAQALLDLGVQPGDRVALAIPNCTAHVIAFYAVLRIGAVVVEHNPTYTAGELAHQLADSGAVVALVWEKTVPAVLSSLPKTGCAPSSRSTCRRTCRGRAAGSCACRFPARARSAPRCAGRCRPRSRCGTGSSPRPTRSTPRTRGPTSTDLALLQYTGGTTGTPKGAMLTHRNLVANAVQGQAWTAAELDTEVVYGVLPFFHAFGLTLCLNYAMRVGATLVAFPNFDPALVLAAQKRLPGTFLPAVPPMLDRLAGAAKPGDLGSFRYAISARWRSRQRRPNGGRTRPGGS